MKALQVKASVVDGVDPYASSPGSLTLKNKLGITDAIELNQCELVLSSFRRQQGIPSGNYAWEHLKSIQQHLFQDVYEWAGEARETPLKSGDGRDYVSPANIDSSMNAIFKELERDLFLVGSTEDQFFSKAAYYYNRMNMVHPFRTGNGRVIRTFIEELANNNGLEIDWKKIDRKQWQEASIEAANGERTKMKDCFKLVVQEKILGAASQKSNGMTVTQSQSAAEQAIKLVKRCIKSGKGLGASSRAVDHLDIPKKSHGPSMS